MAMIVEKALGMLGDAAYAGRTADILDVEWYNTYKRVDRKATRGGKDVGIRMDHATSHTGFTQDQVVYDDGTNLIAINILPCPCIRIKVSGGAALVKLCYEIGNRHAPFFYGEGEGEFLTPEDGPILALVRGLGAEAETVEAKLLPERSISSARGHSHGHSH